MEKITDRDFENLAKNLRVVSVDMKQDIIVCKVYIGVCGRLDDHGGEDYRELRWNMRYWAITKEIGVIDNGDEIPPMVLSEPTWEIYHPWSIENELHLMLLDSDRYKRLDSFRKPAARILRMIKIYAERSEEFRRVFCAAAEYRLVKRDDYDTECRNFLASYNFFNKYEVAEKIIRAGNSKVFNEWHAFAGISMEAFLEELDWLYEAPARDEKGKLRRELGITRDGTFVHMYRSYYSDGSFAGCYDEKTNLIAWQLKVCAQLNYDDRV